MTLNISDSKNKNKIKARKKGKKKENEKEKLKIIWDNTFFRTLKSSQPVSLYLLLQASYIIA